ncbi:MAG: hypothetical protein ABW096_00230 [Candidatus Thiodiazotropha sp.]
MAHTTLRLVPDDYWHNVYSGGVTFYDDYLPSIAEQWYPNSKNLLTSITDRIARYETLNIPIDNSSPIVHIENNRNVMGLSINKELEKIRAVFRGRGLEDRYEGYDTEVKDLYYGMTSSKTALKLSFELLTSILQTNSYYDIWAEQMFKLIQCAIPRVPITPFALISNDGKRIFAIPTKFVEWYAEMCIKQLFIYIYRYMLRLCIANRQTFITFYKREIISKGKSADYRYTAFNCRLLDNEHVQVTYHCLPTWDNIICNVSIARFHNSDGSVKSAKLSSSKDYENLGHFDYSIYENNDEYLHKDMNNYLRYITGKLK